MKKFRFTRKTFINILIPVLINTIIISIILSLSLYISSEKILINYLNSSSMSKLSQYGKQIASLNETIKDYGFSLLLNNDVQLLLTTDDKYSFYSINAYERIAKSSKAIPYIHSIYLYNDRENLFYSTWLKEISSGSDFFDKPATSLIQIAENNNLVVIPRVITITRNNISQTINVYTYIFYSKSVTGTSKKDCLIMNIYADWLTKQLDVNQMDDDISAITGTFLIIDNKGRLVSHPESNKYLQDISKDSYIQTIMKEDKSRQGYNITTIDNSKWLVTFFRIPYSLDWTCINIVSYSSIQEKLSFFKNISIVICIIVSLFGVALAVLISNRIYRPIKRISSNIRTLLSEPIESNNEYDELKYLSNSFVSAISKNKELEKTVESNISILKRQTLNDILFKPFDPDENFSKNTYSTLKIDPYQDVFIILIRIDTKYNHTHLAINENQTSFIEIVQSEVASILSTYYKCETVNMGNNQIVLIANHMESYDTQWPATIVEKLEALKQICLEQGISISSTFSPRQKTIRNLHLLYKKSLEADDYRMILGYGCIINTEEVLLQKRSSYVYPFETQEILLHELINANKSGVESSFEAISETISQFYPADIVLSYCILASNIFNTLNTIQCNGIIDFKINFHMFNKDINEMETLEQINIKFKDLFNYVFYQMERSREHKALAIINNVKTHITDNFSDYNLSTQSIADRFKISPDYLLKLFKNYTGEPLHNYISTIRLNKVEDLLANTNLSIKDISTKVGFSSEKYLFKLFKQQYGVAPGEYRIKNSLGKY